MSKPDRTTTAGAAYLDLRKLAAETKRPTDELHQFYALECVLDRLGRSPYRDALVLKGGVLLAAYAQRRATRDIDLAARYLHGDAESVRSVIGEVLAVDLDDGLSFDIDSMGVETIRDAADYPGLRVKVTGNLATAVIRFHIDINIGDPIWPDPQTVQLPRLLGPDPLLVSGYAAELILAEKIVTTLQRGTANTRWRDFADIAALAKTMVDTDVLVESIARVAQHRESPIRNFADVLDGYADLAQPKWVAWRRKQRLSNVPPDFADLLADIIAFVDPILGAVSRDWE